ncbi:hypothetical protein AwWohl_02060 [Gammaproteobacteria bacterium]|nr:hypothetical protein AwWohl_02060 [Gammaproteobacteria bacterium]
MKMLKTSISISVDIFENKIMLLIINIIINIIIILNLEPALYLFNIKIQGNNIK